MIGKHTHEDNFFTEVVQLGEKQRKPSARVDEECDILSNLASDTNEPFTLNKLSQENILLNGRKLQGQNMTSTWRTFGHSSNGC